MDEIIFLNCYEDIPRLAYLYQGFVMV